MAQIKRIQLRGISRNPSDRMTEDGGVAESLNVYLDNTEVAPMVEPTDVTASLGVPATSEASMIYIHKTANYENIIAVEPSKIVAYTALGSKDVITLAEGEEVYNIAAVGNSLAIATSVQMYYLLYKDQAYKVLGNSVPFPAIRVRSYAENDYTLKQERTASKGDAGNAIWGAHSTSPFPLFPSISSWNTDADGGHSDSNIVKALNIINTQPNINNSYVAPLFVRYAAELYDGRLISSTPILLGAGELTYQIEFTIRTERFYSPGSTSGIPDIRNEYNTILYSAPKYHIEATLENLDLIDAWKDLIKSIKVYMSPIVESPVYSNHTQMISRTTYSGIWDVENADTNGYYDEIKAVVRLSPKPASSYNLELIEKSGNTHLVKEIFVKEQITDGETTIYGEGLSEEIKDLTLGVVWYSNLPYDDTNLALKDPLINDDMKHYPTSAKLVSSYNNQLLLIQPTSIISFDASMLNSAKWERSNTNYSESYEITWLLKSETGEILSAKKTFGPLGSLKGETFIYGFHCFPDYRCYRMLVKATQVFLSDTTQKTIRYGDFAMTPHPTLNCAYYYGGIGTELWDLCTASSIPNVTYSSYDDSENKLYVSEMDNPFVFPLEHRYTFQAPIINVAVATKALSQGQFGQFPLYVFTEDGIWAMTTAADGTFVTQKPVSRVICNNPDSVTSIDNAIVFTSDRGLMLLKGSDVVNISPFMHGKHFVLKGTPEDMIDKTDFKFAIDVMQDTDAFLAFIKDASIAYDYAGQRLILLSKSNTHFQYVYYIDTQTWHKQSIPNNTLKQVINSYPECYITGLRKTGKALRVETPLPSVDKYTKVVKEVFANYFGTNHPYVSQAADFLAGTMEIRFQDFQEEWIQEGVVQPLLTRFNNMLMDPFSISIYEVGNLKILDFTTTHEKIDRTPVKGVITTRPFDLDHPDVKKSIKDIRVRGQFPKGAVKFILEGSDDGENFFVLSSLRGKSWKLFRLTLLCDLGPDDRISWVDVEYETRFENKLR